MQTEFDIGAVNGRSAGRGDQWALISELHQSIKRFDNARCSIRFSDRVEGAISGEDDNLGEASRRARLPILTYSGTIFSFDAREV
jgi:hypothetical protein